LQRAVRVIPRDMRGDLLAERVGLLCVHVLMNNLLKLHHRTRIGIANRQLNTIRSFFTHKVPLGTQSARLKTAATEPFRWLKICLDYPLVLVFSDLPGPFSRIKSATWLVRPTLSSTVGNILKQESSIRRQCDSCFGCRF
jgi:hypothetical protein